MARPVGKRGLMILAPLALLLVPLRASPATTSSGTAETTNTVFALTAVGSTVSVGVDRAESRNGAERSASARFVAGRTPDLEIGKAEREGTSEGDSGTDDATVGNLEVPGLVSLTLAQASAAISLEADRVSSSAAGDLASVDLGSGLVSIDGLETTSASEVTGERSSASRSLRIDGVTILPVGVLLATLGVEPLALTCASVEDVGGDLGADTSQACEQLSAAQGAIGDAAAAFDQVAADLNAATGGHDDRTAVQADRDAAGGISCDALDAACILSGLAALGALATEYSVTLTDPTNLGTTLDEVIAALDHILAAIDDLSVVGAVAGEIADGTCASVSDTIDAVVADLSALDPAGAADVLPPLGDEIDTRCAALRATLDLLVGAPLVTLDDVVITLDATASDGEASAEVTATVGSVTLGYSTPVELPVAPEGAADAEAALEAALAGALEHFGIAFAAPEVEILAIDTAEGQDDDGNWFADASVTTLRVTLPSATLDTGNVEPLGILSEPAEGGATGFGGVRLGAFAAPRASIFAAQISTPETVAEVAVFDAGVTFTPASAGGDDEDGPGEGGGSGDSNDPTLASPDLPQTGMADTAGMALLLLLAAVATRRALRLR